MERGETVLSTSQTKRGHQRFKMMAILNASPEAVWSIIEDCDRYQKTMTKIKSARLIRQESANTYVCETVVDTPFPLKPLRSVTRATHRVVPGKKWVRSWKLIEGDYKANVGSWTLKPYPGGRTLVIYKNVAEPDINIPLAIKEMARKKTLPGLMANLRKQVE